MFTEPEEEDGSRRTCQAQSARSGAPPRLELDAQVAGSVVLGMSLPVRAVADLRQLALALSPSTSRPTALGELKHRPGMAPGSILMPRPAEALGSRVRRR